VEGEYSGLGQKLDKIFGFRTKLTKLGQNLWVLGLACPPPPFPASLEQLSNE